MSHRQSPRGRALAWTSLLPWAGGLALAAFGVGAHVGQPAGIWGGESFAMAMDHDSDGLSDLFEQVLWLEQDQADSDHDGWSDTEELARGSDPKMRRSVPSDGSIGVGIDGYNLGGVLHVVAAFYQRGGPGGGHTFGVGYVWRGVPVRLAPSTYLPFSQVTAVPGKEPGDTIHLVDISVPGAIVEQLGQVSFFVTGASAGASGAETAGVFNVAVANGATYGISVGTQGRGSRPAIYKPLSTGASANSSSTTGKICVQSTHVVGAGGASLHLEVAAANCQDGDGACPSRCSATVGSTVEIVDPLILIGG